MVERSVLKENNIKLHFIMVERSLLKENNIKVHFYYGREISVEGKQY